jgi:hypothetical protein
MALKYGQLLVIITVGALTIGSFSVIGLLQSTERIGASGIIVRPVTNPIIIPPSTSPSPSPPPPEPTIEIDVYSDSSCTNIMSDVEWGEIEAGGDSNTLIYVKNNGDTNVIISLTTENWSSSNAQSNMDLSWNYDGSNIEPNEVVPVTLILSVDSGCPEMSSFGFDIVIIGS